jgi:hypothetical protein
VHELFQSELSDRQGNPRRRPAGIEKVLPERAQAHRAQRVEEEVNPMWIMDCGLGILNPQSEIDNPH